MKVIRPSIQFLNMTDQPLITIEAAGRTCYKSEDAITVDSSQDFVQKLMKRGHLAMIEHACASYRVVCDRGVTHEIVRHRLFSYAQESTRYCNYSGGLTFIKPPWVAVAGREYEIAFQSGFDGANKEWLEHMLQAEKAYKRLLSLHN